MPHTACVHAEAGKRPWRGMLLLVCALLLFACMDTTTKFLAMHYNVPLVVGVRYITHCLLMLMLLAPLQGRQLVQTRRTGWVLVRAASLAIGSFFLGLALQRMPVAETTAINFLAPMLVVLLARPVLGERIGGLGWTAAVMGFVGVLLTARPGGSLDAMGVFYALCGVGAGASYQLLSRVLATTERTLSLLFYSALVGALGFGVFLPWSWRGATPTRWQLVLFVSMGISGGLGHYLFTAAYRYAPASLLAPMNYSQLLWAALLGWIVFGHVPDSLALGGMGMVAASGAMMAFKSRSRPSPLAATIQTPVPPATSAYLFLLEKRS